MTRATAMALTLVGVRASPGSVGYRVNAQQPVCLHGPQETAEQAARKRSALTVTPSQHAPSKGDGDQRVSPCRSTPTRSSAGGL